MSVHLMIEDGHEGLMATLSQRDGIGKMVGIPSVFLIEIKEQAKQQAKALARSLGLGGYGFVDRTGASCVLRPRPVPDPGLST